MGYSWRDDGCLLPDGSHEMLPSSQGGKLKHIKLEPFSVNHFLFFFFWRLATSRSPFSFLLALLVILGQAERRTIHHPRASGRLITET